MKHIEVVYSCFVWLFRVGACRLISGHQRQKSNAEPSTFKVCQRWKPTAQLKPFSQFDSCSRFGQSLPSGANSGSICSYGNKFSRTRAASNFGGIPDREHRKTLPG